MWMAVSLGGYSAAAFGRAQREAFVSAIAYDEALPASAVNITLVVDYTPPPPPASSSYFGRRRLRFAPPGAVSLQPPPPATPSICTVEFTVTAAAPLDSLFSTLADPGRLLAALSSAFVQHGLAPPTSAFALIRVYAPPPPSVAAALETALIQHVAVLGGSLGGGLGGGLLLLALAHFTLKAQRQSAAIQEKQAAAAAAARYKAGLAEADAEAERAAAIAARRQALLRPVVVGARVRLLGLSAAAGLNGKTGLALSRDGPTGLFTVQLDEDGGLELKALEDNLELAEPRGSAMHSPATSDAPGRRAGGSVHSSPGRLSLRGLLPGGRSRAQMKLFL